MAYQSLRTLRAELTDIRLAAADTSLWSIQATVNQRARVAINDALRAYPFFQRAVEHSIVLPASGRYVTLPKGVERVFSVRAKQTSGVGSITPSAFYHKPGENTNLLEVHITKTPLTSYWLEIDHERRVDALPNDRSLQASINSVGNVYVQVEDQESLVQDWPQQGFLELSDPDGKLLEVAYYNSINHELGFTGVVKGQMGTRTLAWTAANSITVSPVVMMPPEATAVVMAAAEANMYQFWLSHRALYDQYTALAGVQSLDIAELLGMVRTIEDRADRRYARIKKPPSPGRVQTQMRGDR
jgi:hypothetical protein